MIVYFFKKNKLIVGVICFNIAAVGLLLGCEVKARKKGFHTYIEKPLDRRRLAMSVRQALDEKEAAAFFS